MIYPMAKVRALELAGWGSQSERHRKPKEGVIGGAHVPQTPSQRPRMHASLLTIAALAPVRPVFSPPATATGLASPAR